MSDWPLVICLLVTYKRTDCALRTIQAIQRNLIYPKLAWHIADDGSEQEHLDTLARELAATTWAAETTWTNAERRGVGRSMNLGMRDCLTRADYVLWLEDDWELRVPFDLRPCVQLMGEFDYIGMVRLGYLSAGPTAKLVGGAGHLWWKLDKGSDTYVFVGHAALRHRRFMETYGLYQEGLPAGATELWYCGRFNSTPGPDIVVPAWTGEWGVFAHIGGESLKDMPPEVGP